MAFFNRKLYAVKPREWGPAKQVQASIFKNAERIGVDPASILTYLPLWESAGMSVMDAISQKKSVIASNNTILEENSLRMPTSASILSGIERINTTMPPVTNSLSLVINAKIIGNAMYSAIGGFCTSGYGDTRFFLQHYNPGLRGYIITNISSYSTGCLDMHTNFGVCLTVNGTTLTLLQDKSFASNTIAGTINFPSSVLSLGTQSARANEPDAGNYYQVIVFGKALSTEHQNFLVYDNPYYLLQRIAPMFISLPGGGETPTFKPYWAQNATRIAI